MWRLVPPRETIRVPIPAGGMATSLHVPWVREQTVFGDDTKLYTTDYEGYVTDPAVAGEWGEIPAGTKYVWWGGSINTTVDTVIRDLWLANGFEIEEIGVAAGLLPSLTLLPSTSLLLDSGA